MIDILLDTLKNLHVMKFIVGTTLLLLLILLLQNKYKPSLLFTSVAGLYYGLVIWILRFGLVLM